MISLSGLKDRLDKFRNIDAVWKILRLQAQSGTSAVMGTAFAGLRCDAVACVELHAWQVRVHFHHTPCLLVFHLCDLLYLSVSRIQRPVVIIALD